MPARLAPDYTPLAAWTIRQITTYGPQWWWSQLNWLGYS